MISVKNDQEIEVSMNSKGKRIGKVYCVSVNIQYLAVYVYTLH